MGDFIASGSAYLQTIQKSFVTQLNHSVTTLHSSLNTIKAHPIIKENLTILIGYQNELKKFLSSIPHLESTLNKPEVSVAIGIFTLALLVFIPVIIYRRKKSKSKTNAAKQASVESPTSNVRSPSPEKCSISANWPPEPTKVEKTVQDPFLAANNGGHEDNAGTTINVGAFVRRLRVSGLKVKRIKNGQTKDQVLRLTSKGDVAWSRSIFSKSQPISSLVSAFDADNAFMLEFKKRALRFTVDPSEAPYDSKSVIAHFNAIIKKLAHEPTYITAICKFNGSDIPDDDHDDDASALSESSNTATPLKKPTQTKGVQGNHLPAVSE